MSPVPSSHPWFALTVKHHHEKAVAQALAGRSVESYLPLYRNFHHSGGRMKAAMLPLFPGYVFCRVDIANRLPVLTIPGVSSIVSIGRAPAPIPDFEIESVRIMIRSDRNIAPHPLFCEGQEVLIERGPLKGIQGTLVACKPNYRLVIAIPMLQRAVSAEVDPDWVRPLATQARAAA